MWKLAGKAAAVAGFFGIDYWAIASYVEAARSASPLNFVGSIELHPSFLFLVSCVSIPASLGFGLGLFWDQVRRLYYLLPSERLHALVGAIRILRKRLEKGQYGALAALTQPGYDTEFAIVLAKRLNGLGIATPKLDRSIWLRYLPIMAACAETKDLRGARRVGAEFAARPPAKED